MGENSEREWAAKVGARCADLWRRDPVLATVVLRLDTDRSSEVDIAMLEAAQHIELHLRALAASVLLAALAVIAGIGLWLLVLFTRG